MKPAPLPAFCPDDPVRFRKTIDRFDAENSRDPNLETVDGVNHPRELLHARRLTGWVLKLDPDAPEALRLAARCQHLCRWMIPRNSYAMTRAGYLRWRTDLKEFHARKAAGILAETGYSEELIACVRELNLKKNFPQDPASRVLEDALCLVFLQYQLAEFASRKEDAKLIEILRKTWKKMSPAGRQRALELPLGPREKSCVERALADAGTG